MKLHVNVWKSNYSKFTLILVLMVFGTCMHHDEAGDGQNMSLTTGSDAYMMYAEYCGMDRFCNPPNITVQEVYPISTCPFCYCDNGCVTRGDCCPDKRMSRCVNTTIVYGSASERNGYMIVDTCSDESNSSLLSLCSRDVSLQSMFELGPVTDQQTKSSYKNKYCAECNNVKSYIPWTFEVHDCRYPNFDINYYSSLESIEAGLIQYRCDFSFYPPHDIFPARCPVTYTIDQCNVTGLWAKWNDNIEKACTRYNAPYQMFKNIFCYICNYGHEKTLIPVDTCHMNDDFIENNECINGGNTQSVLPYENTACRKCNQIFGIYVNLFNTQEFTVSSKRPYRASVAISLGNVCEIPNNMIYSNLLHSNYFEKVCGPYNVTGSKPNMSFESTDFVYEMPLDTSTINMSALYERYMQYGGDSSWCNHGSRNQYLSPRCSCHTSCFALGICCPDMFSSLHAECTDQLDGNFTSIVTKCPKWNTDAILAYYCERKSSEADSILDTTPVYDPVDSLEYRNIFCFICNKHIKDSMDSIVSMIIFREMDFKCDRFLEIENFLPLHSTFNELKKLCKVGYLPFNNIHRNTCKTTKLTSPCQNVTNTSDELLRNVTHMCEKTGTYIFSRCKSKYQNIFCEMCDVIARATNNMSTGFLPPHLLDVDNSCHDLVPETGREFPYCETCMSQRYLFSIHDAIERAEEILIPRSLSCSNNQYEDLKTGKCRAIHCSPGKLYRNNSCVPFLQITSNLNYALYFTLRPTNLTVIKAKTIRDLLVDLGLSFRVKVSSKDFSQVRRDYFVATKGCAENMHFVSLDDFEIYAFIQLFIPRFASRIDTEKKLRNFMSFTYFEIQFESLIAKNLPTTIDSMDNSFCKESSAKKYTSINGYTFFFNKFLNCPQLSLKHPDVDLLNSQMSLKLNHLDKIMGAVDFHVINSNDIRVCIADYYHAESTELSTLRYALNIFSFICSVVSMICLIATFIIYCVFSQLRTLPGKNLMTLTLSLFFAHLCTQIGFQDLPGSLCMIIGCCIHYSWLVVFCSSSNCSIHMLRAFNGKLFMSSNEENAVKYRKALIIVLMVPLPFVLTYCLLAYYNAEITPYAREGCFINDIKFLVIFLISPILVMCLMNMLLFCVTFYHIRKVPKTESNLKKRKFTLIFFKLFIITGATWLFQLIDGLFPPSLFSFIVAAMNGGQGLFIFLSYACSKHVYNLIKKRCFRGDKSETCETMETKLNGNHHRENHHHRLSDESYCFHHDPVNETRL